MQARSKGSIPAGVCRRSAQFRHYSHAGNGRGENERWGKSTTAAHGGLEEDGRSFKRRMVVGGGREGRSGSAPKERGGALTFREQIIHPTSKLV